NQSPWQRSVWKHAAKHWDGFTSAASAALTAADSLPPSVPAIGTRLARAALGTRSVPLYTGDLPAGGKRRTPVRSEDPVAVHFPSCTSTLFGAREGDGVA